MKLWIGFFDGKDTDTEGNDCIHCQDQSIRLKVMIPIKMGDLTECVNTAVSASCARYITVFSANLLQALLKNGLNCGLFPLNLPTMKISSIVSDTCFQPRHRFKKCTSYLLV